MAATTIVLTAGNNQEAGIANDCGLPLTVTVTDGTNPVAGVAVTFAVASKPTGSTMEAISATSVNTDANGQASTVLTVGEISGTYTVTATAAGLTGSPITFTATALAVVSLAAAKAYLGFTDTTHDSLIAPWIGEITNWIEAALDQPVQPRNYTEILSGMGGNKIFFEHGRIISLQTDANGSTLNSVNYRSTALDAWQPIVADEAQLFINPRQAWSLELLDGYTFPWGLRNIQILKVEGFDPIPGEIVKMALEMVQTMYDESKAGKAPRLGMRTKSRNQGGGSVGDTFFELDPRWQAIINRYKKLV